jgi:hypothetical protein
MLVPSCVRLQILIHRVVVQRVRQLSESVRVAATTATPSAAATTSSSAAADGYPDPAFAQKFEPPPTLGAYATAAGPVNPPGADFIDLGTCPFPGSMA